MISSIKFIYAGGQDGCEAGNFWGMLSLILVSLLVGLIR